MGEKEDYRIRRRNASKTKILDKRRRAEIFTRQRKRPYRRARTMIRQNQYKCIDIERNIYKSMNFANVI